jgi:uncharacterized membrane protein
MLVLIAGLVLFFGAHSVRMLAPGWRETQLAANERRWKGLYALVSLAGFVLLVWGYALYRPEAPQLYVPPEWGRYVTYILVWLGLVSLAAAYGPPGFIRSTLQHPFLTGVILWAIGHMLANGDAAGVLVFGAFLVYAIWNRIAVMGRNLPRVEYVTWRGDLIAIVVGTVIYLLLALWLHQWLFGVSPMA